MEKIKLFVKNPMNLIITTTCIIVSIYFLTLLVKEIKSMTIKGKMMQCLELSTNDLAMICLKLLQEKNKNI
jgi:hypothetical protein